MTHSDIYEKFMIEYDKVSTTSSYPSLTKYEIATLLDKAYLALIALKFTGNNPRNIAFEQDIKNISDLLPLTTRDTITETDSEENTGIYKEFQFEIPDNCLYYINSELKVYHSITKKFIFNTRVQLLTHDMYDRYKPGYNNLPWIEYPVACIDSGFIRVLVDPVEHASSVNTANLVCNYIRKPDLFVDNIDKEQNFELNDGCAEELINLAIIFATETVESPRLNTKINIKPLES